MVEVGQVIRGKYKLLRLLGDGGMGAVYEAEHLDLGTHVAIKVLHGELARKAGLIDRFLQEARVSAQIRSPHVVQVTDVERTPEGIAYLVMELLQGEPLSNVQKREKKLSVATACEYTLQILQGLEAAHALGVIHRDLKPDNVFLTYEAGRPVLKLIDFGIAKLKRSEGTTKNLTVAGMLMGTPEYMAPEQAYAADKVDVRADLYAVGVMLYEMLSGATPVSGDDPRILVAKVERGEVTPLVHAAPGVQPELAGFVHRAMAPRPEVRFANATEMRLALEAIMAGKKPATAPIQGVPPAVSAAAYADTGQVRDQGRDARELGTGTMMGAPLHAALGDGRPKTNTVAAAPMNPYPRSDHPPPAMHVTPSPYEPSREPRARKRRGSGLVVGLAAVATLLGAGAVVTYVMSTSESSVASPPFVETTAAPTVASAPASPTVATTPVAPLTAVAPLKPPPAVAPDPQHPTRPKVDAGAPSQQAQADAGTVVPPPPGDGGGLTPFTPPTSFTIPGVGSFQFPGPRPPLYPPDQPWPPTWAPPAPTTPP